MSGASQTTSHSTSEKIFGRRKGLKSISEALLHADTSGTCLLAIEGPAGIGKTTLIYKALDNYSSKKSFKLYGKFENHRENTPYSAFKQAFSLWAQQILILPDEEFNSLKEAATSALQTNIPAVIGVFQELEVFFSRKKITRNTHGANAHQIQARFYYFIKKFLRSVTGTGYRLLFFLDDLQWADNASLLLLEELVKNNDIRGLVFITASRLNNESQDSYFNKTEFLKDIKNVTYISLKPLSRTAVSRMIPAHWNFTRQNRGSSVIISRWRAVVTPFALPRS